jgi:hypothetical protein
MNAEQVLLFAPSHKLQGLSTVEQVDQLLTAFCPPSKQYCIHLLNKQCGSVLCSASSLFFLALARWKHSFHHSFHLAEQAVQHCLLYFSLAEQIKHYLTKIDCLDNDKLLFERGSKHLFSKKPEP